MNRMETVFKRINDCFSHYIDINYVAKFVSEHKVAVLASSSLILYGAWFLKRPKNIPPGPYGYPLVGSLHIMDDEMSENFNDLSKKYGDVFCLRLGTNNYMVVLNSYDAVKEAYITRGSEFMNRKVGVLSNILDTEDTIIGAQYDQTYKSSRKIATQALRAVITRKLDDIMDKQLSEFDKYVLEMGNEASIDLLIPVLRIFGNVTTTIVFSKTYSHGDEELDNFVQTVGDWMKAFMDIIPLEFIPSFTRPLFRKNIKVTVTKTKYMVKLIQAYVREHQSSDEREISDIIDAYLQADEKDAISPHQIADTLFNFLPDAVYTAGHTCLFMFVYLLNYSEYQEKIWEEIQEVKGDNKITVTDRPQMPVTESFIMEVFRCVTPTRIGLFNAPVKNTTFRGYNIPMDFHIVPHIYGIHTDPKYFPQPERFKPERFIVDGKIGNTEGFIPFGIGRRMCLGEQLVRNEIFLLLSSIVQKYHILEGDKGIPSLDRDHTNPMVVAPQRFTVKLVPRT